MYSWEITNYINYRNGVLNPDEVMYITNTKEHPQINHIKYNSYDNTYEMWDREGNYFRFNCILFNDYMLSIINKEDIMNNGKDNKETFRLYADRGRGYQFVTRKTNIQELIPLLDEMIINVPCKFSKYMVIQNVNNGDIPYWLNYNNQEEYLIFKKLVMEDVNQDKPLLHNKIKTLGKRK